MLRVFKVDEVVVIFFLSGRFYLFEGVFRKEYFVGAEVCFSGLGGNYGFLVIVCFGKGLLFVEWEVLLFFFCLGLVKIIWYGKGMGEIGRWGVLDAFVGVFRWFDNYFRFF